MAPTRTLLALFSLVLAACSSPPAFVSSAGGKPLAVLIESDPWANVIGSDSPRAAVYQDGLVVLWSDQKRDYVAKQLSAVELDALRAKLRSFGDVKALKRSYDVPGPTDQSTTMLFLDLDGVPRGVSVYDLRDVSKEALADRTNGPGLRLVAASRDLLASLAYPDAQTWTPRVEVMLWPFQYAGGEAIPWPEGWPGLDAADAKKRHEDSYSIFLPPSKLAELSRLAGTLGEKNAALALGGKKWALSYRPVFPGEPVWREAFSKP